MPREKYPEKCPWDLGPEQKMSNLDNWTLKNGKETVCFQRNPDDKHRLTLVYNGEVTESLLLFRARLTYQKLLDKGYKLKKR